MSKPITPRPLSLCQINHSPPFAYKSPPQPFAPGLLQRCSLLFPPMRRWVSNLAAGFGSPFHLLEKSSLKTVSYVHCSTFSIGQKSGRSWEIIFSYYLIPFFAVIALSLLFISYAEVLFRSRCQSSVDSSKPLLSISSCSTWFKVALQLSLDLFINDLGLGHGKGHSNMLTPCN